MSLRLFRLTSTWGSFFYFVHLDPLSLFEVVLRHFGQRENIVTHRSFSSRRTILIYRAFWLPSFELRSKWIDLRHFVRYVFESCKSSVRHSEGRFWESFMVLPGFVLSHSYPRPVHFSRVIFLWYVLHVLSSIGHRSAAFARVLFMSLMRIGHWPLGAVFHMARFSPFHELGHTLFSIINLLNYLSIPRLHLRVQRSIACAVL